MLLVAGVLGQIEEISGMTAFQNYLPEHIYGRVFSLFLIAAAAGSLAGGLLGPALAETAGTGRSLVILGIPVAALSAIFALRMGNLGLSFRLPALPLLEPEVVGHGLYGMPASTPRTPARAVAPMRIIPVARIYRPG